jgi:tRNA nucleotidyltransferase (CCA-adding enzyme)
MRRLAAEPELVALRRLVASGRFRMDAWIVGGALRDRALDRPVSEVDLAVSGDAAIVARAMESRGYGRAFLLSADKSPRVFRVAGRRRLLDVAEIEGGSIEIDLARRDFTVNALAFDVASGELLDPYRGLADLGRRRLAMVAEKNLANDPLRCLRAARLAATHGLTPDRRTSAACRRIAPTLSRVARERIQAELAKLLEARVALPALAWAFGTGVLEPALDLPIPAQKWRRLARRLAAVDSVPVRTLPGPRRRRLRLALVGAEVSPAAAASWLRRLRWSSEEASEVARLLELASAARAPLSDDEAWLWILRAGDRAGDSLRLLEIEAPRTRPAARRLSALLRRKRPVPEVRGGDVLEWLGVPPGPHVGRLLEAVRVEALAGRVRTRGEARRWLQMPERKQGPATGRARQGPRTLGV